MFPALRLVLVLASLHGIVGLGPGNWSAPNQTITTLKADREHTTFTVEHWNAALPMASESEPAPPRGGDGGDVGVEGPVLVVVTVGAALLSTLVWIFAFTPLNRIRGVEDVGWSFLQPPSSWWMWVIGSGWWRQQLSSRALAARVSRLQKMRKRRGVPPVFPNGWFALIESRELKNKQVVSVEALGQNLAVFRTSSGVVRVIDAFCPHLGANMTAGGVVKGDCLECPFHGWQWSGEDGQCKTIPYSKNVPSVAKVRQWECEEVNGFVFLWHDAEGRAPHWRIPHISHITSGHWRYRGRTQHEVLVHIQEIPENGADISHLGHLHSPSVLKGGDLSNVFRPSQILDATRHDWKGSWRALDGAESHMAEVTIEHALQLTGTKWSLLNMTVNARQIGPGLVHLHVNTVFGEAVLLQTVTPLGPLHQKIIHNFYSAPTFIAPFAKFFLFSEACHVERDIMIWNSKQYLQRPLLVAEDRSIKRFRAWYQQFYSKNSPTIDSVDDQGLDW